MPRNGWTEDGIKTALQTAAEDIDAPLRRERYMDWRRDDQPSATTAIEAFGGWNAALTAAGIEDRPPRCTYTDAELVRRLRTVATYTDGALTITEYQEYASTADPSWMTYTQRFGSWNAAKEAADLDTNMGPPQE